MKPHCTLAIALVVALAGSAASGGGAISDGPPGTATPDELLVRQFESIAQSLTRSFDEADHEVLVCRKFAVDWQLIPALLLAEIARGDPATAWGSILDDGYGHSPQLPREGVEIPLEVGEACQRLRRLLALGEFAYLAQTTGTCLGDFPAAIHWRGTIAGESVRMRTDWMEPHLAMRATNFPLPADRSWLEWDNSQMRQGVFGKSVESSASWPSEEPSMVFMGDAYDLIDALRAWHWSHQGARTSQPARVLGGALADEDAALARADTSRRSVGSRTFGWVHESAHCWRLDISLRDGIAIRTPGFRVAVENDPMNRRVEHPGIAVQLIPDGSVLSIRFEKKTPPPEAREDGLGDGSVELLQLSTIELTARGAQVATARFTHLAGSRLAKPTWQPVTWPTTLWTDALMRIDSAQDPETIPDPFELGESLRPALGCERRAASAVNVWIHAMRGDVVSLLAALIEAQVLRNQDGLGHHQLADIQSLLESLSATGAPDASLEEILAFHRICASEILTSDLVGACLEATGSGRFWAATEIAQAALNRAEPGSQEARAWQSALDQLMGCAANPMPHLSADGDEIAAAFSLRMSRRLALEVSSMANSGESEHLSGISRHAMVASALRDAVGEALSSIQSQATHPGAWHETAPPPLE